MEALKEIHEFITCPTYADDDAIGCTLTIIAHYVYFFIMLTLSGCGIFAIPLLLAFGILTMPLWIGKVITF